MYSTDSPVNPTSNPIFVDKYYYCHVFFGLVEWYLDQSGAPFDDVFRDIDTMRATLPEQKIDFDLVEEAFELYRDTVQEFDVVDDFWTSPLSIPDNAMPEHCEESEEEYSIMDLCREVIDEDTDHRQWTKFGF